MPYNRDNPPSFSYDWSTTRIYELDSLWWGVSIGGRHYTGHVKWHQPGANDYPRHELERKLSLRQAKEMDPDDGERYWKLNINRITNRFDSQEQLERAAIKWVTEHAKGVPNWLLIEDGGALNPMRPIAAQGWFLDRIDTMREVAALWDKVPDYKREGEVWNKTYTAWYALLTPPQAVSRSKRRGKKPTQSPQ